MMTRLQIEEGLIAAKSLAESVATLIDKALDEIGDDEHADWTEADAGVALAMHDLQQLSAVTIGTPDPGDLTLADLHHELMRRATSEAAVPDEPQHMCEQCGRESPLPCECSSSVQIRRVGGAS